MVGRFIRSCLILAVALSIAASSGEVMAQDPTTTPISESVMSDDQKNAIWLFALLGVGAIGFGLGGIWIARRDFRKRRRG